MIADTAGVGVGIVLLLFVRSDGQAYALTQDTTSDGTHMGYIVLHGVCLRNNVDRSVLMPDQTVDDNDGNDDDDGDDDDGDDDDNNNDDDDDEDADEEECR